MARPPGPAREKMLDAAVELFASRGYLGTTTQSITERAGVSAGSLFYHFDNKDGLLRALMAERGFAGDLDRVLDDTDADDPADMLRTVGHELLRVTSERNEVLQISLQGAVFSSEHGAWLRDLLGDKVSDLGDVLVAAGVTPRRARLAARALISSLVVHAALAPAEGAAEVFVDDLAELLVGSPEND